MTLGKNVYRAVIIAVCLAIVIGATSCGNYSDNSALEQLENMQNMQNEQAEDAEVPSDDVQKYRVVVSAGASDKLLDKAIALSSAVSDKTGKACTVVRDTDAVSAGSDTMEIQLGYVDRKEAREALGRLNRDDYLCIQFSDTVVLGGKIESGTVSAVDKFISEIIPRAEGKMLMNDGDGFNVSTSYDLNEIFICNVGFKNYDIVCDSQAIRIAEGFRELFASKCGAYPDISADPREGVREIIFSVSEGTQIGFCSISQQEEDILIEADSIYGLSVAVCKFYDIVLSSVVDGVGCINISYPLFYSYEATDLSIVTVALDSSDERVFINLFSQLNINSVDIMTVGAVALETWALSESYIPDNYSYKLYSVGDNKYIPVIYNLATFEDIYFNVEETHDALCVRAGASEDDARFISVYEKNTDNRQANIEYLANMITTSSSSVIATFIGAAGSGPDFNVAYEGVSAEYLSLISNGDASRSVVVMVADKAVECDRISVESIVNSCGFYVFATARDIYCAEYLALIS